MLDSLLSLIAPHVCLGCGAEGSLWCIDCRRSAPLVAERCYRCHRLSAKGRTCTACRRVSVLYSVQAATRYEEIPKQLIWQLKFERARAGATNAAQLMAQRLELPPDVVVTHVPTSTARVRQRGYDQARLIARRIARLVDRQYAPLLLRLGHQQQRNATRQQRLVQLSHAFQTIHKDNIQGRHIILVDDVITTGATLDAAAHTLKAAGAKRVSAVVFAQA